MAKRTLTNGNPYRYQPEDFIREALSKGLVNSFWHSRIIEVIRTVLSGNTHFVADIEKAEVWAGGLSECSTMRLYVLVNLPDAGKIVPAIITYKMTRKAHKVTMKHV